MSKLKFVCLNHKVFVCYFADNNDDADKTDAAAITIPETFS